VVHANVALALSRYVPSVDNPFTLAVRTASANRARYAQIHYQLAKPDVDCAVATSLDPTARSSRRARR
jgi:hypothetical protein